MSLFNSTAQCALLLLSAAAIASVGCTASDSARDSVLNKENSTETKGCDSTALCQPPVKFLAEETEANEIEVCNGTSYEGLKVALRHVRTKNRILSITDKLNVSTSWVAVSPGSCEVVVERAGWQEAEIYLETRTSGFDKGNLGQEGRWSKIYGKSQLGARYPICVSQDGSDLSETHLQGSSRARCAQENQRVISGVPVEVRRSFDPALPFQRGLRVTLLTAENEAEENTVEAKLLKKSTR